MSTKSKSFRPLGAVRQTSVTIKPIQRELSGISGSAMQVPVSADKNKRETKAKTPPLSAPSKPKSVGSAKESKSAAEVPIQSQKNEKMEKEMQEALNREKQLKQKISSLQKSCDELNQQIAEKDKAFEEKDLCLEKKVQEELHWKAMYEKEKKDHEETKGTLIETKNTLDEKVRYIDVLIAQHESKIEEMSILMMRKVEDVKSEMDREIADREEKMKRLKRQMAEALQGNSWERQQQLEELTKELGRIQEEADRLRHLLKASKVASNNGSCSNCQAIKQKLESVQKSAKDKEEVIMELKALLKSTKSSKS